MNNESESASQLLNAAGWMAGFFLSAEHEHLAAISSLIKCIVAGLTIQLQLCLNERLSLSHCPLADSSYLFHWTILSDSGNKER